MTYGEAKIKIRKILMAEIDHLQSHYNSEVDEEVFDNTGKVNEILVLSKIVCEALEKQIHSCEDCRHADYEPSTDTIYCLEHSCMMSCDNCCRDWSDDDD